MKWLLSIFFRSRVTHSPPHHHSRVTRFKRFCQGSLHTVRYRTRREDVIEEGDGRRTEGWVLAPRASPHHEPPTPNRGLRAYFRHCPCLEARGGVQVKRVMKWLLTIFFGCTIAFEIPIK